MNMLKKLGRRLRREASGNPKKVWALGILLLVAGTAWLRLMAGWMSAESPDGATSGPSTAATAADATPASPSEVKPKPFGSWRTIANAIDADALMQSADLASTIRGRESPFQKPPGLDAEREDAAAPAEVIPDRRKPSEVGLVLDSTVVGRRKSTALINGRVYQPGRKIAAADGLVFTLLQVHPKRVILERDGRQYELSLPSGGMQVN